MRTNEVKICTTCKSDNVVLDAWAEWDAQEQRWILSDFFDNAFCRDCDGETTIEEKTIDISQKDIYKIFIIPSSEDDRLFEECDDYQGAKKIGKSENVGDEFFFNTKEERDAFIEGYLSGIGYLGEGVYFTTNSKT